MPLTPGVDVNAALALKSYILFLYTFKVVPELADIPFTTGAVEPEQDKVLIVF